MSKVIAKVDLNWDHTNSKNCSISSTYLPDKWRKSYYITGMPVGYYLKFVYKEC